MTFNPAGEDGIAEPQELPPRYVPNDFACAVLRNASAQLFAPKQTGLFQRLQQCGAPRSSQNFGKSSSKFQATLPACHTAMMVCS